ncbi:MAG TPA: sulfite exporter TauE/SafE family protein [Usitatibacter sp.]|nr:sulfite exporter TauE/SafE family protein [Usitatibacter sp.]
MPELAAYLGIGLVVGFLSGLLGIGGGIIIVSSLALMFASFGFPAQYVMHLAIGTSMACMMFGSFSSLRTHHQHEAVDWHVVKSMTPGVIAGVAGGVLVARAASTSFLKFFVLGFTLFVTAQMLFNLRPRPSRGLPGTKALAGFGVFVGLLASLFGGGGAAVGVPFLTWCNVSIHRAIGTVAALAFPIAIAGTLGYVAAGREAALPSWSLGFVYLPAAAAISAMSVITARWGARLAHRLHGSTLRRIFAVLLVGMATKMALSV